MGALKRFATNAVPVFAALAVLNNISFFEPLADIVNGKGRPWI